MMETINMKNDMIIIVITFQGEYDTLCVKMAVVREFLPINMIGCRKGRRGAVFLSRLSHVCLLIIPGLRS